MRTGPAQPPFPAAAQPPAAAAHARAIILPLVSAAAAALVALTVAALAFVFYCHICRRRRTAAEDVKPVVRRLPFSQIRRATAGFAPSHKLGQGGFGPVFRGSLPPAGDPVAVKVMANGSLQGEREFYNELAVTAHLLAAPVSPLSTSVILPFAFSMSEQRGGGGKGRRLALVYELVPNGSLQDALLGRRCPELVISWPRRLTVALDVARALNYLHLVVHPPVVHGDVKPSNVLLDASFGARLSDFGLATVKSTYPEEENLNSLQDAAAVCADDEDGPVCAGDQASVMGDTVAESTTTTAMLEEHPLAPASGDPVMAVNNLKSPEEDDRYTSVSAMETRTSAAAAGGHDWWWRQDTVSEPSGNGGGSGGVKDYVMEWIRSEIKKERSNSEWVANDGCMSRRDVKKPLHFPRRAEWWASMDNKSGKPERPRSAREWWREEFTDELVEKQRWRVLAKFRSDPDEAAGGLHWWEKGNDDLEKGGRGWKERCWSSRNQRHSASIDWWVNGARRSSQDWVGGEVPKSGGAVSSTPSMRGTVCYVAPEYSGWGVPSERCDIYSFGVLLLVLVSGRRPLQVTSSPMSEFEKASLISWARQLARTGRLVDLIDPEIQDVNHDQALLCITVALLCIQRSPACRPSSKEVLEMLNSEVDPPHLPLEFSPSPPGGFSFKSKKKDY